MTLDAFLDEARALEVSEKQSLLLSSSGTIIPRGSCLNFYSPSESASSVLPQPPETPQKKRSC